MKISAFGRRIAVYCAALAILIYILSPFAWMFTRSFMTQSEMVALPSKLWPSFPVLENYMAVLFHVPLQHSFLPGGSGALVKGAEWFLPSVVNSIITGLSTMAITLAVAFPSAYAFARFVFRGREVLLVSLLATRMIPLYAILIPLYLIMREIGLLDTNFGLVLAYTAMCVPYAVWLLMGFIATIPLELEEAARVDGCSRTQTLVGIVLPLAVPGLISSGIFCFMMAWGQFMVPLILTSSIKAVQLPMIMGVFVLGEDIEYGLANAGGVIGVIPSVILALALQRFLTKGLIAGAVKG